MRRRKARPDTGGLPRVLERALMRRYGGTAGGRMRMAGALRALEVLVRRHPRAALEMVGAGLWRAGNVGLEDLWQRLGPAPPPRRRPSRRELHRLRKFLDREAHRPEPASAEAARPNPPGFS